MFNTLSAQIFDPLGHVQIPVTVESFRLAEVRRRVNRVATLDGGVATNDGGFSDGDRVFRLSWQNTDQTIDVAVSRLLQLYERATLSTAAGVFDVALETYTPGAATSSINLLAISKLSA